MLHHAARLVHLLLVVLDYLGDDYALVFCANVWRILLHIVLLAVLISLRLRRLYDIVAIWCEQVVGGQRVPVVRSIVAHGGG